MSATKKTCIRIPLAQKLQNLNIEDKIAMFETSETLKVYSTEQIAIRDSHIAAIKESRRIITEQRLIAQNSRKMQAVYKQYCKKIESQIKKLTTAEEKAKMKELNKEQRKIARETKKQAKLAEKQAKQGKEQELMQLLEQMIAEKKALEQQIAELKQVAIVEVPVHQPVVQQMVAPVVQTVVSEVVEESSQEVEEQVLPHPNPTKLWQIEENQVSNDIAGREAIERDQREMLEASKGLKAKPKKVKATRQ